MYPKENFQTSDATIKETKTERKYSTEYAILYLQELEDLLQEEQNKVNHLNKVKSKLEQQLDEVSSVQQQSYV